MSLKQTGFYNTALINKATGVGSPQKYVNIFFREVKYFICLRSFLIWRLRFGVKFRVEMNEAYFVWQTFVKTEWGRNKMLDHCREVSESWIKTRRWHINEKFCWWKIKKEGTRIEKGHWHINAFNILNYSWTVHVVYVQQQQDRVWSWNEEQNSLLERLL